MDDRLTIEGNLRNLDSAALRLLAMLQEDCEAVRLSFPRYAAYREIGEGMVWSVQRLNILLAPALPAGALPHRDGDDVAVAAI